MFYKQSHLLNTKHPNAQEALVKAAGVNLKSGVILWPQYLHMCALLTQENAPVNLLQDYWLKVINPKNEDFIPAESFNQTIESLKKTIGTTNDLISGDFLERLWQKLKQLDIVQPSGINFGCLIKEELNQAVKIGLLSIEVFSQLVSSDCSFRLQF